MDLDPYIVRVWIEVPDQVRPEKRMFGPALTVAAPLRAAHLAAKGRPIESWSIECGETLVSGRGREALDAAAARL